MSFERAIPNLVFIGPTGAGKSRLCNFLLDDDNAFECKKSLQSVTKDVNMKVDTLKWDNRKMTFRFIDTQGVCDTTMTDAEVVRLIKKALKNGVTNVSFFTLVISLGRLNRDVRDAIEQLIDAFDLDKGDRRKNVILLISHCESLSKSALETVHREVNADRTLRRISSNVNFLGIPQRCEYDDIDEEMYEIVINKAKQQRKNLFRMYAADVTPIRPVIKVAKILQKSGSSWCTIL
jgi:predicted GTPase